MEIVGDIFDLSMVLTVTKLVFERILSFYIDKNWFDCEKMHKIEKIHMMKFLNDFSFEINVWDFDQFDFKLTPHLEAKFNAPTMTLSRFQLCNDAHGWKENLISPLLKETLMIAKKRAREHKSPRLEYSIISISRSRTVDNAHTNLITQKQILSEAIYSRLPATSAQLKRKKSLWLKDKSSLCGTWKKKSLKIN